MASLRDIFVRLGLKTDPSGFKRAQEGISRVKESAFTLGRVLATGAVAVGFAKLVQEASDSQEAANKFRAVFGDAAGGVQNQLDAISKATGVFKGELVGMSSNIGALIKPSLGSAQAAGAMAAEVSGLALDIASFNNVTSEEAIIALRSSLIGSAEPMQRFGVDTRQAALEQEALRLGLRKTYKDMTEGERIQLRFAAIQRQLGEQGAVGDAANTADQLANSLRNLKGNFAGLMGDVGDFFLPTVEKVVNTLRRLIGVTMDWIKENRKLIQQNVEATLDRIARVGRAVAALVLEVVDAFNEWSDSLSPLGRQILKITAVVLGLVAVMMLPGVPLLMLIALIALIIEDFQTWRNGGESVIGDIIGFFESLIATVESYAEAVTGTLEAMWDWVKEHETGITAVISYATALAGVIGTYLVIAHKAALMAALKFRIFAVQYYATIWGQAVVAAAKTSAAWIASATKSAAAWLLSAAPLVLTAALLTVIIGTLIFLGAELVKMAKGHENFFDTMSEGMANLAEEWGGIGPAIGAMLDEALRFWLEFFGSTEEEIDTFIENATDTLMTFWDNVIEGWGQAIKNFFGWVVDVLPGFGDEDEDTENRRQQRSNFEAFQAARRRAREEREKADEESRRRGETRVVTEGRRTLREREQEAAAAPESRVVIPGPQVSTIAAPMAPVQRSSVVDNSRREFNISVQTQRDPDNRELANTIVTKAKEVFDQEMRQGSQSYVLEAP